MRLRQRRRRPARRRACSTGCCAASIRGTPERVRGVCETVDFHGGRPWAVEVACWDLAGRALGEPLWRLLGGRQRPAHRVCLHRRAGWAGRPRGPRERRAARAAACGRSSSASTTTTGETTSRSWRQCARRWGRRSSIMVDANQGWRMPGDPDPALGRGDGGRVRPRRSSHSTCTGWRSRCRPTTSDGYAALRRLTGVRLAAGEMVRTAQRGARPAAPAAASTCCSATCCSVGGIGGCRRSGGAGRPARAGRGRRTPGRTATGWSRTCTPPARSRAIHYIEVPFDPPAWTAGPARLAAPRAGRDRRRRHHRARRPGRAWAWSPTWTRWSAGGRHERPDLASAPPCSAGWATR